MGIATLLVCCSGIYVSFVIWGLVSRVVLAAMTDSLISTWNSVKNAVSPSLRYSTARKLTGCVRTVSTTPYPSILEPGTTHKFRSVLFLNTVQSFFSACSALSFLLVSSYKSNQSWLELVGLASFHDDGFDSTSRNARRKDEKKGHHLELNRLPPPPSSRTLLKSYAFISLVSSMASPFGFLSLSHISFPTLLLGKSCKLVPVMVMNIVLYRRKFPLYKYLVVAMVTGGIWAFMLFKESPAGSHAKKGVETSSMLGLGLLGMNLLLDGVVNSTQDEVFKTFKIQGPQMMLFMNIFSTIITSAVLIFPTSLTPEILVPTSPIPGETHLNALTAVLSFIASHPSVTFDILLFSLTGAIGQLFIFLTLSLYGSLTLVTITVTRKMMTMLLSVFLFDHSLTFGQWGAVGIVFAAIGIEAEFKRREGLSKKRSKAG